MQLQLSELNNIIQFLISLGVRPEPTVLPGLTPSVETSRGIDLEYEPEGMVKPFTT